MGKPDTRYWDTDQYVQSSLTANQMSSKIALSAAFYLKGWWEKLFVFLFIFCILSSIQMMREEMKRVDAQFVLAMMMSVPAGKNAHEKRNWGYFSNHELFKTF